MFKNYHNIVPKSNCWKGMLNLIRLLILTITVFSLLTLSQAYAATITYTYDNLNRLTRVDYGNGTVITYTYDAAGNRLSMTAITDTGTDTDTIPDFWEIANFGDLTTADDTTDYDNDGLLDRDEYTNNTDPKDPDTDNDGMSDGYEVTNGLDPLTDDSGTPTGTIQLPKTGQTTCYDGSGNAIACTNTGQDGDIQAGVDWPGPRFTDNGDGTVTDNLTGVMWLKDANCLGTNTWQGSLDTVADLNSNPGNYTCQGYTGSYTDWRLPNANELESLVDAERSNPPLPSGHPFTDIQPTYYWSSTTSASGTNRAYYVYMGGDSASGMMSWAGTDLNYIYAWPVRAATTQPALVWKTGQTANYATGDDGYLQIGVAWPTPRFADNGDGTVTDNLTGLIWLKDANCFGTQTWQNALDTVANFNPNSATYGCTDYTANYTDWRLPNRKELHSLTNFSQYNPALSSGHPFVTVQSYNYWSSTTDAGYTGNAWYLFMPYGSVGSLPTVNNYYVWPVRTGEVSLPDTTSTHGHFHKPCRWSNRCGYQYNHYSNLLRRYRCIYHQQQPYLLWTTV